MVVGEVAHAVAQIYTAFLSMQGFFRTFGIMCTNFDSAFRLATFFIPNMIQYAGYMIPVFQMKRWLFWIVSIAKADDTTVY